MPSTLSLKYSGCKFFNYHHIYYGFSIVFFWFDPAPLSAHPHGSSGSLQGFGVTKLYGKIFLDGVAGVRTPNLKHQRRTL